MQAADSTVEEATAAPRPFRRDIEGLRGIAILLVVLYHADVSLFAGGYVGVDVFFALSGFLITGIVVDEMESTRRLSLLQFYARRFRRLMPASAVVLLSTLFLSVLVLSPLEWRSISRSAAAAAAYASNVLFAAESTRYLGASTETDPYLHTWSLSVEEQFYFVWPVFLLVLFLIGRRLPGRRALLGGMTLMAVGSFAVCLWLTATRQPWAFFLSPPRFWEFGIGGLAALVAWRRVLSPRLAPWLALGGVVAVIGAAVTFGPRTPFPGWMAAIPVLGTVTALVAGSGSSTPRPSLASTVLDSPPLQWVGRHSYSWYLWHWPALVFAAALWPEGGTAVKLGAVSVGLGLSAATYVLVERPARGSAWLRARPGISVAGGLGAAFLCLVTALGVGQYASTRLDAPEQRRLVDAVDDVSRLESDGCAVTFLSSQPKECVYGVVDSDTTVVLFGDSHAGHLFPGLEAAAQANGWRLEVFFKSSCPSIDVPEFFLPRLGRTFTECTEWRDRAMEQIEEMDAALVVVSNYADRTGEDDAVVSLDGWEDGLRSTADRLAAAAIPLALVTDVPTADEDVPICLSRRLHSLIDTDCDITRSEAVDANVRGIEEEVLAGRDDARLVDLTSSVCPEEDCPVDRDGIVLFSDSHHLSATFSRTLADELSAQLLPLIDG